MRALVLLGALALPITAQADGWQRLYGQWQGEGVVSGLPSTITLGVRPALEGRARHLVFSNRMQATDGSERMFAAEALYWCATAGHCRGHWYDSRGMVLPLEVAVAADRVSVDWGDARTERGRTEYRVDDEDRLQVTDQVRGADGAWKTFGRSTLRRQG